MPRQRTWLDNSAYEIEFGPIALSTGRGALDLGSAAYVPPFTAEQFLGRTRVIEGDRIELSVGSLSFDEIDLEALLNTSAVVIGKARISDWSVHILSDKHKPPNPNSGPPTYPHEAFQRLPIYLTVAEIALENGAVRYSERHKEGVEPGHIWWDRLQGTLTNLSNDPARMTFQTPAVLSIGTRMFDQVFLNLEWRLPLLEPGPTMSYSGELSPMRAPLLSSILVPLEGMRITDGVVDQAWFDVDIRDGRATGVFNALYHDLGMRFEDRSTGGRSLKKRLFSFAAGVLMPHNNRDRVGKPAREGKIDWTPEPDDPFFKIFWAAVRDGVLDLVMP